MVRFSTQEQAHFAKRLGMILRSGMPIMQGLHMLGGQAKSSSAKYIYGHLISNVERGQQLSSGLEKFEKIFGEFCINIVRVGESSGTLHENLEYLAEELKKKEALRKKVIGALVYPAVIVFATVGISLVLTVYIFPKITPIFQSFKTQLPVSTRALIAISNFLMHDGMWLFLGVVAAAVGYIFLLRLRSVHYVIDRVLIHLPLFGKLSRNYNLANCARTLGLLLKSDMGIVHSLAIVSKSMRNLAYREALERVASEATRGQKISREMLENPTLFPPLFVQMIAVGEQTGNLAGSLMYLSEMYEEEISDLTKNLTTMLEPVLMIVMGVIVGFIAVSIITPIYGITSQLTPH
jgi:type IV pilus assembly protein PilC